MQESRMSSVENTTGKGGQISDLPPKIVCPLANVFGLGLLNNLCLKESNNT